MSVSWISVVIVLCLSQGIKWIKRRGLQFLLSVEKEIRCRKGLCISFHCMPSIYLIYMRHIECFYSILLTQLRSVCFFSHRGNRKLDYNGKQYRLHDLNEHTKYISDFSAKECRTKLFFVDWDKWEVYKMVVRNSKDGMTCWNPNICRLFSQGIYVKMKDVSYFTTTRKIRKL